MIFNQAVQNWDYCKFTIRTLGLMIVVAFLNIARAEAQTQMIHGFNNVYSPHMEFIGGSLKMYFGGWRDGGQVRDTIYRSDCWHPHLACRDEGPVQFFENGDWVTVPSDIVAINDPTIVNMGSYLAMYFTGCPAGYDCMKSPWAHRVYMSTSWADDGMFWSTPVGILGGYWLPSATKNAAGEVLLYANQGNGGQLHVFNLTASGANVVTDQIVTTNNGIPYINVEVRYQPSIGLYQMVGEPLGWHNGIDYLASTDGVNFNVQRLYIAGPAAGQVKSRTPAMHPHTASWIYFGSTFDPSDMANQIYFGSW